MHELPLVFLTVLAQASAGTFFIMMLLKIFNKVEPSSESNLTLISVVLLVIAGGASIFHLGQPLRAFNSILGVGRSPMSNEIIAIGLYGALVFISFAERFFVGKFELIFKLAKWLAMPASVLLVISITRVYQINTVPAWDTVHTSLLMILTALICGGAINAAFIEKKAIPTIITIASSLVLILITPSYFEYISTTGHGVDESSIHFWSVKYVLLTLGLVFLTKYGLSASKGRNVYLGSIIAAIFIISELSGRIGFYNLWFINM